MAWRLMGNLKSISSDIKNKYGKVTIYSIADSAHSTTSDHSPKNYGFGTVVAAIDVMLNDARGAAVAKAAIGRPDVAYVIFRRTIWSAAYGWRARRYTGKYHSHVHISSKRTKTADNTRTKLKLPGTTTQSKPATKPPPTKPSTKYPALVKDLKIGMTGGQVDDLQKQLKARGWTITVDNEFGKETQNVVKEYQREKKLAVDGIVGEETWRSIWTAKVT